MPRNYRDRCFEMFASLLQTEDVHHPRPLRTEGTEISGSGLSVDNSTSEKKCATKISLTYSTNLALNKQFKVVPKGDL